MMTATYVRVQLRGESEDMETSQYRTVAWGSSVAWVA